MRDATKKENLKWVMDEKRANEILPDDVKAVDGGLTSLGWYLAWWPGNDTATLDGSFTADDLEAIAWWMRNHDP